MTKLGKDMVMRRVLALLGNSLLETAACYPFVLLYMVFAMDLVPGWMPPLIWLLHALGTLAGIRQAGGKKALLPVAALIAAALIPLAAAGLRAGVLAALVSLIAVFRGLIVGRKELWREIDLKLPLAGLGAALIVYGVSSRVDALEPYRIGLYFMSLFTLFTVLLRWNGDRVRDASNAQETDRQLLRRILARNRRMTWLTIAVIALLSLWNGLGQGLAYVKHWLAEWLRGLGGGDQPQAVEEPPAQPQQPDMGLPPASPTPHWVQVASQILFYLLAAVVALVLLALLYRLLRRWLPESLRALLARLAQRLRLMREIRRTTLDEGAYVDEVEKIERVQKRPGRWRRKRGDALDGAGGGDPRRAYESLIRRAVKQGYGFRASLTPSENGTRLTSKDDYTGLDPKDVNRIVDRYNEVRYGSEAETNRGEGARKHP
ncbi:hypothetical protein RJP21_08155 [Paenibacillus sp. VCA1]|uniref:hypothetical protein n=1 Tax=Paenibacillus sp. VCA1 TaxID=3039148 RepID=UPI0028720172|nr:hypothetical protein [Paenibacillus sp. VCA1]MDR9853570.1 hypothetical protein [Paenibacillus sp. VCA1]